MKQRIDWIDIAKCIGIWLMIFNHISLPLGQEMIKFVIASFHMPLFFVISGLTIKQERMSVRDIALFILKRFLLILIPYYIWALIYANGFSATNLALILYGNNQSLRLVCDNAALWFLPCLFVSNILTKITLHITQRSNRRQIWHICAAMFFAISGGILSEISEIFGQYGWPLGFNIAFIGAGFMLCGNILRLMLSKDWKLNKIPVYIIIVLALLICTICIAYMNRNAINNSYGRVIMARSLWGNLPIFICSGIVGSLMIFVLAMILERIHKIKTIMCKIGQHTLVILAIHGTILKILEKISEILQVHGLGILLAIIISIAVLILSYISAIIIKSLAPSLAGGNTKLLEYFSC